MGGLSSIARLGTKGLKKYLLDYKFKSPPRYEGSRNIGPLETMPSKKEIEAPSLQDAKKLLKEDSSYIRDRQKLKDEIGEEANPRVSFDRITEDGNIIKEAASKKRFRLEQEARVLPYLEPQNLPITNMGDKESFLPTINKIINDPKLNETQKNKIIEYINQYTDGLITPEELYNKSFMATKEVASEAVQKTPTKNILKNISDEELSLDEIKKKYKVNQKQKRVPEVQEAAQKLYEGKISKEDYDRSVKKYQPIQLITEMPEVPSLNRIEGTLSSDKIKKGIVGKTLNSSDLTGKRVASRLDIPAYEDYDTWIVSLHDGTKTGGQSIGYSQSVVLKNVDFKSSEKGGLNIARGKTNKATIARIHGDYVDVPTTNVYEKIQLELNNPNSEYIQIGMNPFRHSYFYDKKTMEPILSADEVLQVGPLVLGKGVVKGKSSNFKFKEGGRIMRDPNKNYNAQRFI